MPQNVIGLPVRFKIQVTNLGGYQSASFDYLTVIIADVPSKPVSGPISNITFTDSTKIMIVFTQPYLGGSVLTNFEV